MLSLAVAETATEAPKTVEPFVGALKETVGAVASGVGNGACVAPETTDEYNERLPAASVARTR